ncbi:MFS transporter [Enterobacter mori]|uniref:MFS transporter n=1 Tax=Enterobacter mori TaxID=539813 RepID=UPI001EDB2A26|nr:MFS transporter [Enterobacter mori]UKJ20367.1 MFS transporter [Enterobacter mori]
MTTRRLHPGSGNHGLFLAYRIISRCYFHLPVLLLYFWTIDMGMYRIIFLLALYGLTSTFSSGIPGWLLRFSSPRQTVIAGELLKALGMALMLWSTRQSEVNLTLLVASQLLGGAGFTIALTTDAALLRQLTAGDQHRFMQIQTMSQSGMFIATLVAGSLGSILFDYNPQWPFIAAILVSVISSGCVLLIRVQESEHEPARPVERVSFSPRGDQLFWMLFYSISRAFTLAPFIGFIPFYFIMVNVDPLLFGAVLSCFTLSSWGAIKIAGPFIARFGVTALLATTSLFMTAALGLFASNEWLAAKGMDYFISGLLALVLLGFGSGTIRPVTLANLDLSANTPDERMRVFARMERDFGLANAFLLTVGAWLLVSRDFTTLMLIFCLIYISVVCISALLYLKNLRCGDHSST